ncbi:MAG TPA: hypothetical protein VGK23_11125 [Methanomassiliicoccales archaeon]|jgi:hypothetical protein
MSDDIYSNVLADEFLPGVMYPFNWSVLAEIMDSSWNRIRRDLRVEGEDLQFVRTFFHHAYWNLSKIAAVLKTAGVTQTIIDRLFESPMARGYFTLDDATADRVLDIGRSAIALNLEQAILESEGQLVEIQRKQGKWETEEEMLQEFDQVLNVVREVIFRETSAWLLVGINFSLLDEWTGHLPDTIKRKHHEPAIVRMSQEKMDEVRSTANRFHSYWETARSVRAMGRSMGEERLFALGERFVSWNLLEAKEDVRYLTVHEISQIVSGGCATNTCNNYALRARVRRTEMDQHSADGLPAVIRGETAPILPWRKERKLPSHNGER